MRILVTGAAGFVGSHVANAAEAGGTLVTRHVRTIDKRVPPRAEVVVGDVRELTLPRGIDGVIHCASAGTPDDKVADVCAVIRDGTARVVAECRRVGARLVHMSSGSVYAPLPDGLYHEGCELRVGGDTDAERIACAKLDAEALVMGRSGMIARGFAMYGPLLPRHFAAAEFMRNARAGLDIRIRGTGAVRRSYTYVLDVARALLVIMRWGKPGHVYNVAGGDVTTMRNMAQKIANKTNVRVIIGGDRDADPPPFVGDCSRLRALGFYNDYGLTAGVNHWWGWETRK